MAAPELSTMPPPTGLTIGAWRERAICRNHPRLPPSTWDDTAPGEGGRRGDARAARVQLAKAVCRTCPVATQCLADVDLRFDEGIRGGEDLRDVRAARRRERRVATTS